MRVVFYFCRRGVVFGIRLLMAIFMTLQLRYNSGIRTVSTAVVPELYRSCTGVNKANLRRISCEEGKGTRQGDKASVCTNAPSPSVLSGLLMSKAVFIRQNSPAISTLPPSPAAISRIWCGNACKCAS